MVGNNMIYNDRLSTALVYASNLKHEINYKRILKGEYDNLIERNKIIDQTLEFFISTEEYEKCQKLINIKNKINV
ncbi:MAG: hypothetical protein ACOCVF_00860 [bacterium]